MKQGIECGAAGADGVERFAEADDEDAEPEAFVKDGILRNSHCQEKLTEYTSIGDEAKTLYETFQYGVNRNPKGDCTGKRADINSPYVWKSYEEVAAEAKALGSFLKGLGINANETVGLSGKNAPEYLTAIQGCFHYGITTVPIYDTFGEVECKYIMEQAGVKAVFVSAGNLSNVLAWSKGVSSVKKVIVWGAQESTEGGEKVITYEECVKLGKESPVEVTPPKADDLATIMYTSGTT